ncbi:MAG: META domain-containing protein [Actinomycetota bacterium]
MSHRRVAALLAALTLFAVACTRQAEPSFDVLGFWWAVEINGEPVEIGVNAAEAPWLEFTGTDVGGSFGCNNGGGEYTLQGDQLRTTEIVSELQLCSIPDGGEEMVPMERALVQLLGSSELSRDGDTLTMRGGPYTVVLVAADGPPPIPEREPSSAFGPLDCAPGVVREQRHPDDGTPPEELAVEFEPTTFVVEPGEPLHWWGLDAEGEVVVGVLLGDNGPESDYQILTCV